MAYNYDEFNGQSLVFKYNVDNNGNPITVKIENENKQVSTHGTIQLEHVPDEFNRVLMLDDKNKEMVEVFNKDEITPTTYYIDYNNGVAYLDKTQFGKTKIYNYYSRGLQLIGCSRIFDEHDVRGQNVLLTLQEIIDAGKECIRILLNIGDAWQIIQRLERDIAEGRQLILDIEGKIIEARADVDGMLVELEDKKTDCIRQIDEAVQNGMDNIVNVAGNIEIQIPSSAWVLNNGSYEKQITHNLNSEKLHVSAINSDTKEAITIGYKVVDKSNVILKSDENINANIILSASYYNPYLYGNGEIAEEVVAARKGETSLDVKIGKIDTAISEVNSSLDSIERNKAGIDYVNNKINKLAGGTPKGVYPNITALEEIFPTGVEGIYITDDDKYWNYYDGERWVKGGVYQGNGISEDSVKDIHCKSMLTETNSLNSISNLLESSIKPTIGGKLNLNIKLENGVLTCTKYSDKTFGFVAFSLSNNLIFNTTSKTKWLMYYEENLNVHCIGLNGVDLGKKIIVNMNNFNVTLNGQIGFDEVLEGDLISITFASKLEVYKVINGTRKLLFELDAPNRIGFLVGGDDGEIVKNLRDGNLKNELILSNVLTGFKNENLVLDRIGLLTDLTLPTATSSDLECSYSYDGLNVSNVLNEKTFGAFAFNNNNEIMFTATDSTKFIIYKEDGVNYYFIELTGVNKGNLLSLNKTTNAIALVGKTTIENEFTTGDLLMFVKYQNTFYLLNRTKSNVIFRLYDFNKFGFVIAGYRGYIAKSIREFKSTYLVSDILLKSISNSECGDYKGKNIVCFGDSITWYDTQVPDPNWTTIKDYTPIKGYISYIRDILGANTINEGISGQTTEEICARIREYNFSNCVATTITSGTNDFLHNKPLGELKPIGCEYDTTTFYGAYQSALEYIIKNYPKVKIYLATHIRGWKNVNNGIIASDRTYADALVKIAELYGLPIVDWNKITRINEANKTYFSIDNVEHDPVNYYFHPSDEFHKYMGETLVALIKNN